MNKTRQCEADLLMVQQIFRDDFVASMSEGLVNQTIPNMGRT